MEPEFSVVIPTFNRPDQLTACLRALAVQQYPKERFEVIVVDDGGRRPAARAANAFANTLRIRAVRQPNAGPAAARNTGACLASGTFLAFTDDDCAPAPGWLAAFAAEFRTDPSVMAGGKTVNALTANLCAETSQLIQNYVYDYYNADRRNARFFASNNVAAAARCYREMGGFNPGFRTSEDRDLCDRWLASGRRMVFVPTALVHHSHRMGIRRFLEQHYGYGRGARRFLAAHRLRDRSSSTLDYGFYSRLPGCMARALKGKPGALRIGCLLLLWQAANTAGFAAECLRPNQAQPARLEAGR